MRKHKKRPAPLSWEEYQQLGYYIDTEPCGDMVYGFISHLFLCANLKHKNSEDTITSFIIEKLPTPCQTSERETKLGRICRQQEEVYKWSQNGEQE